MAIKISDIQRVYLSFDTNTVILDNQVYNEEKQILYTTTKDKDKFTKPYTLAVIFVNSTTKFDLPSKTLFLNANDVNSSFKNFIIHSNWGIPLHVPTPIRLGDKVEPSKIELENIDD